MRIDPAEHSRHGWRVEEVASDFELIDAWALPATGTFGEFDDLCEAFTDIEPGHDPGSVVSGALFTMRMWLGERLGWDDKTNELPIPGCDEISIRDRLPPDLLAETGETAGNLPFRPIFRTADEWAMELSNSTVHAVVHLGWAPQDTNGTYRGQMGIYVKNRGRLGQPYMAAIAPFRHYIVYPALLRRIEKAWNNRV